MVLEVRTRLFPHQLLAVVRKIEARLGRKRIAAKGPRTIDIDIVLFGRAVIRTADLEIPHPRMSERRFVLEPLGELVPELRHPISRQSVRELLAKVGGQQGRRLDVT
jgi:2-amino-4-hydroxy-6-hydroxymethyldihydropteridine diphosphokinase